MVDRLTDTVWEWEQKLLHITKTTFEYMYRICFIQLIIVIVKGKHILKFKTCNKGQQNQFYEHIYK